MFMLLEDTVHGIQFYPDNCGQMFLHEQYHCNYKLIASGHRGLTDMLAGGTSAHMLTQMFKPLSAL